MLREFKITSKDGFSIWFDRKYKKEYYVTSLEMCKTKFIKEKDGKYNTIKLKSGYSNTFDNDTSVYYSSSDILNPFEENYGMFLINFLNADFSCFETAYLTFFCFYGFELLEEYCGKLPNSHFFSSEQDFEESYQDFFYSAKEKIKKLQNKIRLCVNYSYNLKGATDYKTLSAISKFITYSIKNNFFKYTEHINIYYNVNYAYNINEILVSTTSLKNVSDKINNRIINPTESNIYNSNYISNLIYISLNEIITNENVSIGICKNCGKYFISHQKRLEKYCKITYSENDEICKNIGIQNSYKKKQKDNPCLILYRKTYQKKLMYAKRSQDEKAKESFNEWKLQARQKVKDFNNGLIKDNELIEWLEK